MKRNDKGRKIYKTKEKNYYGKSPADKVLSACLTLLLIGGIGIIGYSAAGPLLDLKKSTGDSSDDGDTGHDITIDDSSFTGSQPATETVTEGTSAAPSVIQDVAAGEYMAVSLSVKDISSLDTLKKALDSIPSYGDTEIEYVEIPLKITGGSIYYNSTSEPAWRSEAVKSTVMIEDIAAAVRDAGYRPAAVISTFSDNILPAAYPESGYVLAGTYSQWIDDSLEAGGKPWLSPYSDMAMDYLGYIADEAVNAGFETIICSDIVFPDFRDSDLAILDERLSRSDRYLALTSAANTLYERILSGGSRMLIEVSAAEVFRGNDDVLRPMLLSAGTVIVDLNMDELKGTLTGGSTTLEMTGTPEERTKKIIGYIKERFSDFNTVIRISGSGISEEEMSKAAGAAAAAGFSSFVLG